MGNSAYATAVGTSSNAHGTYASALGTHSQAWGHYSVAIGMQNNGNNRENGARGFASNAIGLYAHARGIYSNAIGSYSEALYNNSLAFGRETKANAVNSTAIGSYAETLGVNSVAIGYNATADIDSGVALGDNSKTNGQLYTTGYNPLEFNIQNMQDILGADKINEYISKKNEMIELDNKIYQINEKLKDVEYKRIYAKEKTEREEADKLTIENRVLRDNAINERLNLIKYMKENFKNASTWESTLGGVSIGNAELGLTRQINNVSAGLLDTDAVNVAQLKNVAAKFNGDTGTNIFKLSSGININGKNGIKTEVTNNGITISLDGNVNKNIENLNIGLANAIAMANLPQIVNLKNGANVSAALGTFNGDTSVAVGLSGVDRKASIVYKASGALNTKGKVAFGIGVGYQFNREVIEEDNSNLKIKKLEEENNELKSRVLKLEESLNILMKNFIKK